MIRPADELGSVLTGRSIGEALRERIEVALASGHLVVVDFEGVEAISPSFADEIFGKLSPEATESGQLRFENLSGDLLDIARFVAAHRAQSP